MTLRAARACLLLSCIVIASCAEDDGLGGRDAADRQSAGDTGTGTDDITNDIDPEVAPPDDTGMDIVTPPGDSGIDRVTPPIDATDTVTPPMDVPAADLPRIDTGPADVPPLPPVLDVFVPGAPADAPTRFGGPEDTTRAPLFVYPTDNTIVPPNLQGFEVHFRPGTGNDLFEVAFVGMSNTIRIYTGCMPVGGGCVVVLDASAFNSVARAARPSGQVRITIRGTSTAAGGRFGRSATQTLGVTDTDLRGGMYYWSALAGNIMRYEFGLPGARSEVYRRAPSLFECQGCHSLSRDGRRITVGVFIPGPSTMHTYDTASRAMIGGTYGANFATFNNDNSRLLISDGVRMSLLDANTGTGVPGLPGGFVGSMPDWSPDGRTVVFSRPSVVPPIGGSPGHNAPAALQTIPWSGTAFGAATDLVPSAAGVNNYYPAYSPDGQWVLFNRSNGESYNNIAAQLWAVRSTGGAPTRLTNADGTTDLGNSWPKWAPFVQTYQGEPLMWLTFASRRDYGLRLQQQSRTVDMRTAQLWMAAFRPNRAAGGGDASVPAFWLPMQNLAEGNHIAQWAQEVRRQTCGRDSDCAPGERCTILTAVGVCVGN